jgi:uncharacterized protein (DUF983 family)
MANEAPQQPTGLRCRQCGCGHLPVFTTRSRNGFVVRVRICRNCGRRHQTSEKIDTPSKS